MVKGKIIGYQVSEFEDMTTKKMVKMCDVSVIREVDKDKGVGYVAFVIRAVGDRADNLINKINKGQFIDKNCLIDASYAKTKGKYYYGDLDYIVIDK